MPDRGQYLLCLSVSVGADSCPWQKQCARRVKVSHAQVSWQLLRQFKSLGFRLQFFNFAHRIGQFLN